MQIFKPSTAYAIAAFVILFSISVYYVYSLDVVDRNDQLELIDEITRVQAASIERQLTRSLSSTYMLAQEVRYRKGNFPDFEVYAEEIIQTLGGISNLQLAPDGVIERIHPLAGNEKALGHNLLSDDARSKEAHLAIKTRKLTLAGPFELIQGGKAVIGRNPVFFKKQGKEHFWGFVSALIYLDELLTATELEAFTQRGYAFQLSRIHPDTSQVEIFAKSSRPLDSFSSMRSIDVPNGSWAITVSRPHSNNHFLPFGIAISFVVALIFALLLNRTLREPERLRGLVKQKTEALEILAFHDPLTGLLNRRFLSEQLGQEIRNLNRHGGHIAVMYLDLDDFKRINDTLGHDIGDHLLTEVAQRIRGSVRSNDIIARLGGDEFAVVLLDLNTPDEARVIAEKIICSVRQPLYLNQREVVISITVGITMAPDDSQDIVELFCNADLALFASKRAGKNQLSFFNVEMQQTATHNLLIEEELRQAISNDEFFLVYQPIIALESSLPNRYEALLRWQHPQKGIQSPGDFIEVAERTGLIVPMGYWVLSSVCEFIQYQLQCGQSPKPVSINISARQLKDEDFAKQVEKIIRNAEINPGLIELEITESMLMEDVERAINLINHLKHLGMSVSIDDFGTGYSSLSQLKQFPVSTLKIDRSFIKDLDDDFDDRQIVEAITAMVHKLGIEVVAEGIETPHQLEFLRKIGCDYGQGYLFSKPLTASDACAYGMRVAVQDSV